MLLSRPSTVSSGNELETAKQSTKVLLVEDNPADAELVCSALGDLRDRELYGPVFHIRSVERLADASACLSEQPFDIILLDLSLPDSASLEHTFAHVHTTAPDIPIIVLTGLGDEVLGLKMVRDGAQDYLIKSRVERYVLVKTIRYAIERQRGERALRRSEEEFRAIVETTREWIWAINLNGILTYSNPTVQSILGYKPEELLYQPTLDLIHPGDHELFKGQMSAAALDRQGWSNLKLRWRHKQGGYRWLEGNSSPICLENDLLIGFRGSDRDITEREMAKAAQAQLQLKLIEAQEAERHRISRELHDQMGQSIAALMLGLTSLAHAGNKTDNITFQLQHLRGLANDLARDIHSVALDLRPTALDDLGLEEALSNYLEGWSRRWQIGTDFHSNGFNGRRVPAHLETTIYRVAQEALTNIVRHAKARTVSLILERTADRVVAIIEDDGCGFDVDSVTKRSSKEQRLGLLGMEERVALVGGSLTLESTPGIGTSVYVRIPISSQVLAAAN